MRSSLFSKISKFCSGKFLEMEKVYKSEGNYVPLLYDYGQDEPVPINLYQALSSSITEKIKNAHRAVNKQELII